MKTFKQLALAAISALLLLGTTQTSTAQDVPAVQARKAPASPSFILAKRARYVKWSASWARNLWLARCPHRRRYARNNCIR